MKKLQNAVKADQKLVIGLTGGFASGKTTVAGMFRSLGGRSIAVIDADEIAHQVIRPGTPAYRLIVGIWGKDILKKDRTIDRKKFGQCIFSDKDQRKRLERIIHPVVIRAIEKDIRRSSKKIIILDVPLLVETGLERLVDKLVVVNAAKSRRIKRKLGSSYLKHAEIIQRMNAQLPLEEKVRLADFIIDNNGPIGQTRKQVKEIWMKI